MARGWESKAVEAQIDMAELRRGKRRVSLTTAARPVQAPNAMDLIRKRESLTLSRTRVVHELTSAQNPRYIEVLHKALVDLDAQLAKI